MESWKELWCGTSALPRRRPSAGIARASSGIGDGLDELDARGCRDEVTRFYGEGASVIARSTSVAASRTTTRLPSSGRIL